MIGIAGAVAVAKTFLDPITRLPASVLRRIRRWASRATAGAIAPLTENDRVLIQSLLDELQCNADLLNTSPRHTSVPRLSDAAWSAASATPVIPDDAGSVLRVIYMEMRIAKAARQIILAAPSGMSSMAEQLVLERHLDRLQANTPTALRRLREILDGKR